MEIICGIYKITNLLNGKVYIGYANNIIRRWREHRSKSFYENSSQYNTHFYRAIRQVNDFTKWEFKILEECPVEQLKEREKYWIAYYNSTDPKKGYNETAGGESSKPVKLTLEDAKEIQELLLKTNISEQEIAYQYNVSQMMISLINTGANWPNQQLSYPLRSSEKKHYYCLNCGKEISRKGKRCPECAAKTRVVPLEKMPVTREELKNLIRTTPFTKIAEKYSVTDNAVRKWCDKFELPRKASDIKKISDEEWENI